MPSFDIVSEIDMHEVSNGVDQAKREVSTRFDFKGTSARYEHKDNIVTMTGESEFQLQQLLDILQTKLNRRGVDIACIEVGEVQHSGKEYHQEVVLRQGIDGDLARKIVKMIKERKMKVQAAIQGEKIRVSGKKRDDLQQVIALLKAAELEMPLQYENFRD